MKRLRKQAKGKKSDGGPHIDDGGCLGGLGDAADEFLIVVAAVALIVAVVMWGPALVAFAVEVLLVVLLTGLALVGVLVKILFRRPWRVMALRDVDEVWVWHQVGWAEARRLADAVRSRLDGGLIPESIATDRLDPASPIALGVHQPHWTDHPLYRLGTRLLLLALAAVVLLLAIR